MAQNTASTTYLDHGYNVITGQVAECMECNGFWWGIPLGFIYNDPMGGWHQDDMAPYISGYCKPCATVLADLHHRAIRDGSWNERDMEDERAQG